MFGAFDRFDTFGAATRAAIFHTPGALPDVDFVAGHISYTTLRARYPDAQLVTVLREPVSRLLSHWLYWRGHNDAQLAGWGAWAEIVKLSRGPLVAFLKDQRLACQNDNQVVRMLLWPHALIPADRFIDPADDAALLADAYDRISDFDFIDVVEGGGPGDRMQVWLGRPVVLERRNETGEIPAHLRNPLDREMTPAALGWLARCSRLDTQLWLKTAACYRSYDSAERLAETSRLVNVARFAGLLACPSATA